MHRERENRHRKLQPKLEAYADHCNDFLLSIVQCGAKKAYAIKRQRQQRDIVNRARIRRGLPPLPVSKLDDRS